VKRGPKPKGKVEIKWSANFAYAVGLIVSDGCLSNDGRHIVFTSKDIELIHNFQQALNIKYNVGRKARAKESAKKYFIVQIGDVYFFNFLVSIGITPAKSLTIEEVKIPEDYFFDFVRGCFDGDGCSYSYWDPRWKSSFMFYLGFASGSLKFLTWLKITITKISRLAGRITSHKKKEGKNVYYQLRYSKYEAIKLVELLYKDKDSIRLSRKYLKIKESLDIVRTHKGRVFIPKDLT
jgi:hypothetical protein